MADFEINDLSKIGVIHDVEDYELPPEAFTTATNVRCQDGGIERIGGRTQCFGTPTVAPHFALPVQSPTATFWIYVSLTKAYAYDGTSHTDITRTVGGNYGAANTREWNGTLLGGVPILNNGTDTPQFWSTLSVGTPLANLTNWPAATTARVIRSFGPYLVAFDVTKAGTRYPHMVKWSHPADPGTIPASWDETDETRDAGEQDLADVLAGIIKDALPLKGRMYIYKEGSTWRMTPITGGYIFDFDTYLETSGILAPRCMAVTPDGSKHVVATNDDVIIHDGASEPVSLLTNRMKRYLQNQMDAANYVNSFMFAHPLKNEVWFCFPLTGATNPNHAFVFNVKEGGITEVDNIDFRNAATGSIQNPSGVTWATVVGAWDDYTAAWSTNIRRQTVVCNTGNTKLLTLDTGSTNDGTAIAGTLQRTGLGMTGRKRNGEPIVDFHQRKQWNRIRPKISGGPVSIRLGFQDLVGGPINWTDYQSFDPSSQLFLDFLGSGQSVAVEFMASEPWRIAGYVPDIEVIGEF